jgi:Leucine-rich repeat (LRR) protein
MKTTNDSLHKPTFLSLLASFWVRWQFLGRVPSVRPVLWMLLALGLPAHCPNLTLGLMVLTCGETRQDFSRYAGLPTLLASFATLQSNLNKALGIAQINAQSSERPSSPSDEIIHWATKLGGRCEQDETGRIVGVDLRHAWVTDGDLRVIGDLEHLVKIDLSYTKVNDEGLEQLKRLENVQTLNLHYAEYISDVGLSHLKHWKKLRHLDVRGTKVSSTLFEHIAGMSSLQSLDVGFSRVNDDDFERLCELPALERLSFGGNKMSGAALPLLKPIRSLRSLSVGGQQRTDSGLWSVSVTDFNIQHIVELSELSSLDLGGTSITDRGVAMLSKLSKLQSLDLSRTKVTAKGLEALTKLPELRHLKLHQAEGIDDNALRVCQALEKLEILELNQTKLTSEGLSSFAPTSRLKKLSLGGVLLTPEEFATHRDRLAPCHVTWWQ